MNKKISVLIIFGILFLTSCSNSKKLTYNFAGIYVKRDSVLILKKHNTYTLKANNKVVSFGDWQTFYPSELALFPYNSSPRVEFELLKKRMILHGNSIWLKK